MRLTRRGRPSRLLSVDITAMIDVIFLLFIFFLTTAQFVKTSRVAVQLSQERGEGRTEHQTTGLIVNLTSTGELLVANRLVDLAELEQIVHDAVDQSADQAEGFKLMIRADRQAQAAALNELVTMLRRQGVGAARLATETPRP